MDESRVSATVGDRGQLVGVGHPLQVRPQGLGAERRGLDRVDRLPVRERRVVIRQRTPDAKAQYGLGTDEIGSSRRQADRAGMDRGNRYRCAGQRRNRLRDTDPPAADRTEFPADRFLDCIDVGKVSGTQHLREGGKRVGRPAPGSKNPLGC